MMEVMKFLLPLLLVNYAFATEGACPNRFIAFNDTRCFYISNVLTTYHEAKKICGLMDAQLYTPNLDNYELEGKWLFKYIYVPFFWVAAEKNITNLSTQEGHWVDGNDVKKNMTFMLWDYNHRYNLNHNKIIFGKTIKTAWTHIAGMRSDLAAKLITHQDESHRILGHKKDGHIIKLWNETVVQLGQMPNANFNDRHFWGVDGDRLSVIDFIGFRSADGYGSEEQFWKLDDGKLLNRADAIRERKGHHKMPWFNYPGPPERPIDMFNSDGPWAFGPENEQGRFHIEHTELKGRLGYARSNESCKYFINTEYPHHHRYPCTVMLHMNTSSVGYKNPIMFKKEWADKGDCPRCSNGYYRLQVNEVEQPYFEDWSDIYLSIGTRAIGKNLPQAPLKNNSYGIEWHSFNEKWQRSIYDPKVAFQLFLYKKMGRYGKETYGNVWDVEKMSMPHIRRKTGKYARPYGQTEYLSKGLPNKNMLKYQDGRYGFITGYFYIGVPATEFTSTIEQRTSDMQILLPHVWGDHTYKSSYGHAYLKTHKYLWYHCAVVKESGLWPFTWIPAQCDLMRFPFVCSTDQTE